MIKSVKINENTIIEIKEFTIDMFKESSSSLVIGRRGSGKTFLTKSILKQYKNKENLTIIISKQDKEQTDQLNTYYNLFPDSCVYDDYNKSEFNKLIKKQKYLVEKYNSKETKINPNMMIVYDDSLPNTLQKLQNHNGIMSMILENKTHMISYIINCDLYIAKSLIKCNIDYTFILNNSNNKDEIYKYYKKYFESFEIFDKIYTEITKNYGSLVIVNNDDSNNIYDKIFWYRAT